MAHDGTGAGWDETAPADGDPRKYGPKEIRDLWIGLRIRMAFEHETLAGSSAGGEHKAGSAKAYYTDTEPTLRPDGVTSLDDGTKDAGRLWVDTTTGHVIKVYKDDVDTFVAVSGTETASGDFAGADLVAAEQTAAVGFIPDVFILHFDVGVSSFSVMFLASQISGVHKQTFSTAANVHYLTFELDGTDVLINDDDGDAALDPDGTCYWFAMKF